MTESAYFREKAQQCRDLLELAREPEVIEQLKLLVREFEREAVMRQHTVDLPQ